MGTIETRRLWEFRSNFYVECKEKDMYILASHSTGKSAFVQIGKGWRMLLIIIMNVYWIHFCTTRHMNIVFKKEVIMTIRTPPWIFLGLFWSVNKYGSMLENENDEFDSDFYSPFEIIEVRKQRWLEMFLPKILFELVFPTFRLLRRSQTRC